MRRKIDFRLELLACGCWVVIGRDGGKRPANLVEIKLWKRIKALERRLSNK